MIFQPPAPLASELEERLPTANRISLFLDFDGTLAPISADPSASQLEPETSGTLEQLSSEDALVMTIISGRAINDLRARIGLKNVIYAGNHGLEIQGHGFNFIEPVASASRETLEQLCRGLSLGLRHIEGAVVECKGLTASVHHRRAAEQDRPEIQQLVQAAVARQGALFRVSPGRKVFDIVPRTNWHKGAAVEWINGRLGEHDLLTIYLGDDTSDEDAFSVLPDAITIKIGEAAVTSARYQLPGPAAVQGFLRWLSQEMQSESSPKLLNRQ
ncbi:MAG TPA: trehalose-phosphatase [Bryobacteraceae bacterium]|nr:trehalose-phosphatase [Bryobacteraceae bacterium]